jgi:hypothetical protein
MCIKSMNIQCALNAHGRRDAATKTNVAGCAVGILFLELPRDGLASRDGLRAGLMIRSFTVVKRNAFATRNRPANPSYARVVA